MDPSQVMHIQINWIPVAIQCFVFIASGTAAVIKVTWNLAEHEKKVQEDIKKMMDLQAKEQERKVARVYERLDETKNWFEGKLNGEFVRKDMCSIMHNNTAMAVDGMNGRIDNVEKKIDELKDIILSLMAYKKTTV